MYPLTHNVLFHSLVDALHFGGLVYITTPTDVGVRLVTIIVAIFALELQNLAINNKPSDEGWGTFLRLLAGGSVLDRGLRTQTYIIHFIPPGVLYTENFSHAQKFPKFF
jgi:hypothetical protein